MNDQSQMMMNQPPQMMMNPVQGQLPVQQHMMNQSHQLMSSAAHSQAISSGSQMMTQPLPPMMLNRSYNKPWQFQDPNQNPNPNKKFSSFNRNNNNWKGKKVSFASSGSNTQGYRPPTLKELQNQNRLKARKYYGGNKKKFNNGNNRFAPYAPQNTTSFIIRAKKSGGIASLVSPCPVTPAILPTPIFSPSREVLGDMAKEEWGVDGYGSMKGLIRLRSPEAGHDDEEDDGGGSSESDVEEHVEVERRLDHDLSRFEMIYPSYGADYHNVLESRVDDQDTHIAQLEEEKLTLKERLFLMERELGDLRRRLQFLERQSQIVEDVKEAVVENGSDNESEGGGSDVRVVTSAAVNENVEMVGFATGNTRNVDVFMEENDNGGNGMPQNEVVMDVSINEIARENELNNERRGGDDDDDDEIKPQNKDNEAKCDEAGGSEFAEEQIVEEEKDELSREETRNEAADNTETKYEEVHLRRTLP